ncbi:MAG: hypothetical protein ACI94Y_003046 [Maribacter sp.]|jgi:hypothetical protein
MLEHNKLLIDKDCPMCSVYGSCFKKSGWIDEQTLETYQDVDANYAIDIDMDRARNEIALLDTKTTETIYGINAMIKIVSHEKPLLAAVLNSKFIFPLLKMLYSFISYNRKVIIPARATFNARNCTPDSNLKYRWVYIIFVAIFTGVLLNQFTYYLNMYFGLEQDWKRELFICFGQILWQMTAIYLIQKKSTMEYLGNMSTVSMIGGFLLIPILMFNYFFPMQIYALVSSFFVVVGIMFFEHIRRCKILDVPLWMTFSWVMFRTVVLGAVLIGVWL